MACISRVHISNSTDRNKVQCHILSFTKHLNAHLRNQQLPITTNHTYALKECYRPKCGWYSLNDLEGIDSWVGLCHAAVSRQSAKNCYATMIVANNHPGCQSQTRQSQTQRLTILWLRAVSRVNELCSATASGLIRSLIAFTYSCSSIDLSWPLAFCKSNTWHHYRHHSSACKYYTYYSSNTRMMFPQLFASCTRTKGCPITSRLVAVTSG